MNDALGEVRGRLHMLLCDLEALRPFVNTVRVEFQDAWNVTYELAANAAHDYAEAMKREKGQ